MSKPTVSRSRYEREKAAREAAERFLEEKSRALYSANRKLEEQALNLASLVEDRTKQLSEALKQAQMSLWTMREAEIRREESEVKFRSFIENANDMVFTLNIDGMFEYLSPRITEVLGYRESDLSGQHFSSIIHPDDLPNCAEFFNRLITTLTPEAGLEYRVRHADGSWYWHDTNAAPLCDKDNNVSGILGIGRDIHQRKRDQEKLYQLANFDTLTGLANRSAILTRLRQELVQAKSKNASLAVMFLDLNNFKALNDMHGHKTGDIVLCIVAERLQSAVRKYTDAVGRLGGDEFLIILPNVKQRSTTEMVAKRIKQSLDPAIETSQKHLMVGCSLGIAIYPEDAADVDALVSRADTAMYEHKASKLGDAVFYGFPSRQN